MSWVKETFSSSLGKKLVMAITGLFLIQFLLIHLIGNFPLLLDDGEAFNQYAHFMKHNKIIVVSEVVLFAGFIFHIVQGLMLAKENKSARSQGYAVPHKNDKVNTGSKYMAHLGIILLVFLIWHLMEFFSYKYFRPEQLADVIYDGVTMPDLYSKVRSEFKGTEGLLHVIAYSIAMLVVGTHLFHGFQSAFQSIGWNHKKYTPIIKKAGTAYAIVIPALFAVIRLIIYIQQY